VHVLHAIHDFLPRHRAGSEIYALALARAQMVRHHVTVLCADYDPGREHGHVAWRVQDGVPVAELVNNWRCGSFEETYRPPVITDRIRHIVRAIRPDVVHVHNLLNLSFDLPAIAREHGIPVVATLHDYTLVCPSGGQRVHRREQHVCHEIDPSRCARCFAESPFSAQAALGPATVATGGLAIVGRAAAMARRHFPALTRRAAGAARRLNAITVEASDIEARLAAARQVFDDVAVFVAPSAAIGREFERLGVASDRLRVSDYGMPPLSVVGRDPVRLPLRVGFVGTLVWHKGAHVLIEALRAMPAGTCRALIFGETRTFPEYTADLRERSQGLPIEFRGGFDPDAVADIYAQMDVLVVPSLWPENSPLVIHEAFMAGVPVLGARVGGIPELVTHGVNGLLYEATSAPDLTCALRRLVDRPSLVGELAAGAPPIKALDRDAAEWEAVYREVARAGARSV
jgi:glycosyltransferase involved in cell wall biosynthesis